MPIQDHPFGPGFVLGGTFHDPALKFRFEVWSRHPNLPRIVVKRIFNQWMGNRPKGERQKKFPTVRVPYYGGPY
jgi:hypothetical protein